MPATVNNGGDVLARGGVSAKFRASDNVSQEKWDAIFGEGSGPKLNNISGSDTDSKPTGNTSVVPRKTRKRK